MKSKEINQPKTNKKKQKSNLIKSIKNISAARDRDKVMSDGGGSGRSDTNDFTI